MAELPKSKTNSTKMTYETFGADGKLSSKLTLEFPTVEQAIKYANDTNINSLPNQLGHKKDTEQLLMTDDAAREKIKCNVETKKGNKYYGVFPTTLIIDGKVEGTFYSLNSAVTQVNHYKLRLNGGEEISYKRASSAMDNPDDKIKTSSGSIVEFLPATRTEIANARNQFKVTRYH